MLKGMRNAINMNVSPADGEQEFDKEFDKTFGVHAVWQDVWPRWKDEWTRQYPIKNEADEQVMRRVYNKVMQHLRLVYRRARFSGKGPREAALEVTKVLEGYYADPTIA